MITLASTNNQNMPICQTANEDSKSNPDTITGSMSDSKLYSQSPMDMYVYNILKLTKMLII